MTISYFSRKQNRPVSIELYLPLLVADSIAEIIYYYFETSVASLLNNFYKMLEADNKLQRINFALDAQKMWQAVSVGAKHDSKEYFATPFEWWSMRHRQKNSNLWIRPNWWRWIYETMQ